MTLFNPFRRLRRMRDYNYKKSTRRYRITLAYARMNGAATFRHREIHENETFFARWFNRNSDRLLKLDEKWFPEISNP